MGHEDGVVRAEDEVALPVQHVQSGTDVSFGDAEPVGEVGGRGCPAGAGERVVHGHPEVFAAGRVGDHVGISSSSWAGNPRMTRSSTGTKPMLW